MSTRISVRKLRREIASVLKAVERGEQVIITRRGKSVARIVPEVECGAPRDPGPSLRGSVRFMSRDFDDPIPGLWESNP